MGKRKKPTSSRSTLPNKNKGVHPLTPEQRVDKRINEIKKSLLRERREGLALAEKVNE